MVHTMLLASNVIPVRSLQVQRLPDLIQHSIQCDVVFGSPSADCRGTGICKITGTNGLLIQHRKECKKTQAIAVERPDKQGLTLIFFRSSLCVHLYRHHFRKGELHVAEPCLLPESLRRDLDTTCHQILPGTYRVTEESGYFHVDVDCAF